MNEKHHETDLEPAEHCQKEKGKEPYSDLLGPKALRLFHWRNLGGERSNFDHEAFEAEEAKPVQQAAKSGEILRCAD